MQQKDGRLNAIIIYYFSGTGNSLHVARELKKRLKEIKLEPILTLLNEDNVIPEEEKVGFVFPIYVNSIPGPVKQLVNKIDFSSVKYIFTITTNCGFPGKVDYLVDQLLKAKGAKLDVYYSLKMAINNPTGLMPAFMANKKWSNLISNDKIVTMEIKIQEELNLIAQTLKEGRSNYDSNNRPGVFRRLLLSITEGMSPANKTTVIGFIAADDCNSCGICEEVCPSGQISLFDGKPQWQKHINCYFCYACFNFCPQQAIVHNGYKYKTGRYKHPDITVKDIAAQKQVK